MKPHTHRVESTLIVAALAVASIHSRAADSAPAWSWDGVYKADLLYSKTTHGAVGNLGLRATADAGVLFGWDDTTLHAELLWNHGSKSNRRIGTTQGISNLEVVESAARIYATWIQHEYKASGTSVLFGLYDLNAEFYSTDASGLLIHPSFGIGIDFSQSGRNGPSIFPNLGLAVRAKQQLGGGYYLQGALIDGVPGDPDHPGRTTIHLSRDDGALLVAEFGWQDRGDDGLKPGHWGIGGWRYTQRTDRIDGSGSAANQGVYALAQGVLFEAGQARTTGFMRAGVAKRRVNVIDLGFDAGVLVEHPFGKDGPAALTAGLAVARYGRAHRNAVLAREGFALSTHETALEVGARWQLSPSLALQPLLQQV
jgi:porin